MDGMEFIVRDGEPGMEKAPQCGCEEPPSRRQRTRSSEEVGPCWFNKIQADGAKESREMDDE